MPAEHSDELLTAVWEEIRDGAAILRLSGEIDISSAPELTSLFETVVARGFTDVVVDATKVTFMDSTGLHALVEGKRLIHGNGTRIFLVPSPQVRRVLELVFPDPLFAARLDSVDDALAAIGEGNPLDIAR